MPKSIINWDNTTVGTVKDKEILKHTGLTKDDFLAVDDGRHSFLGKIGEEFNKYVETQPESSTGFSVSNVFLGGRTTGDIVRTSDNRTFIEVKTLASESEALVNFIISNETIFNKANISDTTEEE